MMPVEALSVALLGAMSVLGLFWHWARECRCDYCAHHKQARRVLAEEKRLRAERSRQHEADRAHNFWHKGSGWQDGAPDRFNCPDPACRRNRSTLEP